MYKSIKVPKNVWLKLKQLALQEETTIAKVIEKAVDNERK